MNYAGKTFKIKSGQFQGEEYRVEDYWRDLTGKGWADSAGNMACIQYAIRSAKDLTPLDDRVLYGKIGCLGHLIHVNEIGEEI